MIPLVHVSLSRPKDRTIAHLSMQVVGHVDDVIEKRVHLFDRERLQIPEGRWGADRQRLLVI